MSAYSAAAMRAEAASLPHDLERLIGVLGAQVDELVAAQPLPRHVILSGSGDSLFAAQAAEYAFGRLPFTAVVVRSTQRLADYGPGVPPAEPAAETLVVGISASGGNHGLAAALRRTRAAGHRTVALVGTADSPVGRSAHRSITVPLPSRPPSPGIRSYQGTLLALLLLANRYAAAVPEATAATEQVAAGGPPPGPVAVPDLVARTLRLQQEPCRDLAERIAKAAQIPVLGGGPALGTARYVAAKIIEGAGLAAQGQDPEEWWHVERFATDKDAPVIVLASAGPSHERAARLCAQARTRGHWLAVLAPPADEVCDQAHLVLPVPAEDLGIWSPLVEHVFAGPLAAGLAELLGRHPFHRR